MNIYQKLLKIQQHVSGLGKDSKGMGYEYVSGAKVLSVIKPLMNELGLLLKQELVELENTRQDYFVSNKYAKADEPKERAKYEILSKCKFIFTWVDTETGDKDVNIFHANGQNDWDKGVGSALTYAERYFLLKYFHIATDEDDIDNPKRKPEPYVEKEASKTKKPETTKERIDVMKKAYEAATTPDAKKKVMAGIYKTIASPEFTDEQRAEMGQFIEGV